jgi:uncharacterized membrane protein YhhN
MNDQTGVQKSVFALAVLAGLSYLLADHSGLGFAAQTVWKGAGVGLLALWCALHADSRDGWLIAAVMAFGALGDVLFETSGMTMAALAFAVGHILSVLLYTRNRRAAASLSQLILGLALLFGVPLVSWGLTHSLEASFYSGLLGAMASTAWTSRFPRYRTGIGAVMFVVSDWLIFARIGPLAGVAWVNPAIWLLYFGGQALIAVGVVGTLRQSPDR